MHIHFIGCILSSKGSGMSSLIVFITSVNKGCVFWLYKCVFNFPHVVVVLVRSLTISIRNGRT